MSHIRDRGSSWKGGSGQPFVKGQFGTEIVQNYTVVFRGQMYKSFGETREMVEQSHLPHYRLFILGAGFSKPAGLPLARELLDSVRREVRRYSQERGGEDGTLEQDIGEWTKLYPKKRVDLERVLAYSHRKHYLRLRGSDESFEDGSRSIVAARRAIQRILIDRTPADTPSLYRRFSRHLSSNDLVLTFNYDTLLEQSLDAIGKLYTLTPNGG